MRRLYLIRHTTQELPGNKADRDRELTPAGKEEARVIGEKLADYPKPEVFLISAAERATQTGDIIIDMLEIEPDVEYLDELYYCSIEKIYSIAQSIDDKYNTVAIVAHNPTIHKFAMELAERGEAEDLESLASQFLPGTTLFLDLDIKSWSDLKPKSGRIDFLFCPVAPRL
jgi:phosphohistidine phosphatase